MVGPEQNTMGRRSLRRAGRCPVRVSALVTLVAGVVLERSGEAASSQVGLSGVLYGATVLALATSLPELSTGLQAIRQGDDNLAMSDIFGGNAFLPVLFLVATLSPGKQCCQRPGAVTST